MWEQIGIALCLMLIIEGMLPFLYPKRWRQLVESLANTSDQQLRIVGLLSMVIGVGIMLLIRR